jgi:creatinine amidohydrolase
VRRYAELLPGDLERAWHERPIAVCPWGALEWHGPHLPLGLDGLVAEAFAERLAERTDGVLLPTTWLPITTLPHALSLSSSTDVVRGAWRDLLAGLRRAGARIVCLVTGHYAQGHELELYGAALEAMRVHADLLVLAATPLELLGDPDYLDHAGRWETAQLLAVRPDLVHLERLPEMAGPKDVAVLGEDPRRATREEGEALIARALDAWVAWVDRLLRERDRRPLVELYARRSAAYEEYARRYYSGSWEEAIRKWWADR